VGIVAAAATLRVEQPAGDAGPVDFAGILVLQLGQAAFAAAVAKRFPFGRAHRLERLGFPEWLTHRGHVARASPWVKRLHGIATQRRHSWPPATVSPSKRPVIARSPHYCR